MPATSLQQLSSFTEVPFASENTQGCCLLSITPQIHPALSSPSPLISSLLQTWKFSVSGARMFFLLALQRDTCNIINESSMHVVKVRSCSRPFWVLDIGYLLPSISCDD